MSDKNKTSAQMVKAVIAYKTQRERIKERQRKELEDELFPWKADVGDEILLARTEGKSIATIASIIGIQNRTFIYEMIAAANVRNGGEKKPERESIPVELGDGDDDDNTVYRINYFDGFAQVVFPDGDQYEIAMLDGDLDLPEEWGDHTKERRALYKDIIKELREHGDS